MKILQYINSLHTAGAEVLVYETTRRFVERGHEVDIFLLYPKRTKLYHEVSKLENVNVFGIEGTKNIYHPINIYKSYKLLKAKGYDIVHVHLFPSFYWAALARRAFGKAKLIYTEHNTNNRRMGNAVYRWIDNMIYPLYDTHIAISDTVREKLDEHINVNKNTITTIYNGIDLSRISSAVPLSREELGLPPESKILLQVSAFRPQKDQETLIRAMKNLGDDVHLLLAGEGILKTKNAQLAEELGLSERIHFLGVRTDIPRLLKTADIVILSSHYEGLSLSSVEGLASGKPFIASDVPGLTEVVKNAGILFPEGDFEKLSTRIKEILSDCELYQQTAEACLLRAEKYSIETMVDNYLSLYTRSLN